MTFTAERSWKGLNLYTNPGELRQGEVVQADNVFVDAAKPYETYVGAYGVRGGDFVSRPGVQGQMTAANAGYNGGLPAVSPIAFLDSTGANNLLFGSGSLSSSSGGKLYSWKAGASAPSEIKAGSTSLSLNTKGLRTARLGMFAYTADGVNASYRTDLTSANTGAVVATYPQTVAPSVSLTNLPIDALSSASGWTGDALASGGVNFIPSGQSDINAQATDTNFTGGSALGSSWVVQGAQVSCEAAGGHVVPSGYSGVATNWLLLDDPGQGLTTKTGGSSIQNVPLAGSASDRYCAQFLLSFNWYTSDTRSLQGVKFVLAAFSDTAASTPVATAIKSYPLTYAGQQAGQQIQAVIDFPNAPAEIRSLILTVEGADANVNAASFSNFQGFPAVANISLTPIGNGITLTAAAQGGFTISHAEPSSAYWGAFGAVRLTRDYGATPVTNWSQFSTILLTFAGATGGALTPQQAASAGLSLRVGFRQTGSSTHYLSGPMTVDPSGAFASVDVSTIPVAIRSSFRYFEVVFESDLAVSQSTMNLLTLTAIATAGNLSAASSTGGQSYAPVFYLATEVNALGDTTVINVNESDGSPTSAPLTPSPSQAVAKVTITSAQPGATPNATAPVNGSNTTHYCIYRGGGVFVDGYLRLVATVPVGSDIGTGADTLARDLQNPYVSWNHTTLTLTDNTPDSFLFNSAVYEIGRNAPPVGAQAVATYAGHLLLAKGSTLYLSWMVQAGLENGLYFTSLNLPNDPEAQVKGTVFSVGASDNDPIQAMQAVGNAGLLIFKQLSLWYLQGTDPTNYTLQELFVNGASIGCAAPQSVCQVNGGEVWWLGADNVYGFDGQSVTVRGLNLESALDPAAGGVAAVISPSVRARSNMFEYDRKVYLLAPSGGGDTGNTVAYVFDSRTSTWTRYTNFAFTGGASLSAQSDANACYFLSYTGQISEFSGFADKTNADSGAAAIPIAVKTRGIGQDSQNRSAFETTRPTRVYLDLEAYGSETFTATVSCDDLSFGSASNPTAYSFSYAYTLPGGHTSRPVEIRKKVPARTRGTLAYVTLAAGVTSKVRIRMIGLDAAKGTIGE